jgi:hypothetical protein
MYKDFGHLLINTHAHEKARLRRAWTAGDFGPWCRQLISGAR